jgi:ketosteroid isomerase-like protein
MNKVTASIVVWLFTLAANVSPVAAPAASPDEAQIKPLFNQFMAGCNAKDVNAIMKFYVSDESLLVFDVIPPRQYAGANAYRNDWEEFAAMFSGPSKCEI